MYLKIRNESHKKGHFFLQKNLIIRDGVKLMEETKCLIFFNVRGTKVVNLEIGGLKPHICYNIIYLFSLFEFDSGTCGSVSKEIRPYT